jgi:26S proteasome regulatory subunit N7
MVERLAEAKQLNDKGGDWDRRNRLKVYDGLLAIVQRDFKKASASLLDSVSTFTALELLTFDHFLFYTVLVALKTLERPALKKKVIDSPDVIAALTGEPLLATLAHSFYEGRYADFLGALVELHPRLLADRYFAPHAPWYMREMRVAAYVQFLESYKSVTLAGMAAVFGVTVPFLDKELELLIAAGRVGAKIDAQTGIIQSSRPDTKNAQYNEVIKQGDALLNKVQRLARIISS